MNDTQLALEREAQTLRLELEAAREELLRQQDALDRQLDTRDTRVAEAVSSIQEELMAQLAAPIAQLMTQSHLLETEGKPIAARDVLNVARRVVRALTDAGLALEGRIGDAAAFDPDGHEPLGDFHPARGDAVVVRMLGVAFQGRRLRRAGVVPP